MITLLLLLILLLLVGGFAGVLAGLLGVGGGIVLVPAFYYVFQSIGYGGDQLMQLCVATSLATIVVTSLRSVRTHHAKGAVDLYILKTWSPGLAVGALISVWVAQALRSDTLTLLFAGLAVLIAGYMAFSRTTWRLGETMPGRAVRLIVSPLVGGLSVLMGIGGGSFGVPVMTLYGQPIHRAVATAAGFGVVIAVPSVVGFLMSPTPSHAPPGTLGLVNLPAFAVIVAMTLITTPWGVHLSHKLDPAPLKRVFAVFLCLVALNMSLKTLL